MTGLPAEGNCPECGYRYDQSVFILYGYGRGSHASLVNCSQATAMGLGLLFALTMLSATQDSFAAWLTSGVLVVGICWMAASRRWAMQRIRYPGPVQVRIGPAGCAQRDDLRDPSGVEEMIEIVSPFILVLTMMYVLTQARDNMDRLIISAVIVGSMLWRWLAKRLRRTSEPRIPGTDVHWTPWSAVEIVSIEVNSTDTTGC